MHYITFSQWKGTPGGTSSLFIAHWRGHFIFVLSILGTSMRALLLLLLFFQPLSGFIIASPVCVFVCMENVQKWSMYMSSLYRCFQATYLYFILPYRRCLSNSAIICFVAGKGAMAEVSAIVSVVEQYLQKPNEPSQSTCMSDHTVDTSGTEDK